MLVTCTNAVLLTLLLQPAFGKKIGILTVNLGTIVFIVALSHLVYMTFNWQTLANRMGKESRDFAAAARRMTFPASFWSMICASLGFGSLLISSRTRNCAMDWNTSITRAAAIRSRSSCPQPTAAS